MHHSFILSVKANTADITADEQYTYFSGRGRRGEGGHVIRQTSEAVITRNFMAEGLLCGFEMNTLGIDFSLHRNGRGIGLKVFPL